MQISAIKNTERSKHTNPAFKSIYTNNTVKKGLEFAADNGALFVAVTSLLLSGVARPLVILATPDTKKRNKEYACAKSLASSLVGFCVMLLATLPLSKAMKNIDKNPSKFLKKETINNLKEGNKTLTASKPYIFATQMFKLGAGFILAAPKAMITCAMIPFVMAKVFDKKKENKQIQTSKVNFGSKNILSKPIGKIIDTKFVQKISTKFKNSNFEMHLLALTDILATAAFMHQTQKNKKIEEERKKALLYNVAISTSTCIGAGYTLDKAMNNKTRKFIENFKKANLNNPKLAKYTEGIKIAQKTFLLGGIYYIAIPLFATFFADKADK